MRDAGKTKYFKPVTKFGVTRRLIVPFIKKCFGIKSPTLMSLGLGPYEYDYLKSKYKEVLRCVRH